LPWPPTTAIMHLLMVDEHLRRSCDKMAVWP
jgi:hypothetical protein